MELAELFEKVDREIKSVIQECGLYESDVFVIEHAKRRVMEGGKRFRPALAAATHMALTGKESLEPIRHWMCTIEIIHSGLLDIDDVQDESPMRRGFPATWEITGKEQAINVGLVNVSAYSLICLSRSKHVEKLCELLGRMLEDTVIGQAFDIMYRASRELTPREQIEIYRGKTGAYTFGGPMGGAAIISGRFELVGALYNIGRDCFGPAFQIRDDVLNISESSTKTKYGKEFADDLNEGKPTYPRALFNKRATEEDLEKFYEKCGRMDPPLSLQERRELIDLLEKYNTIDDSMKTAEAYTEEGMRRLGKLIPRTEKSEPLYSLLEFAIRREW